MSTTFTPPLAALTTIFTPPCPTSWLITTNKVPSQDPPFPVASVASCDPPEWGANIDAGGFQYYSPAICPDGFAVGPNCEVANPRTAEGFPAIADGETAVYCVPSGYTCTSDTTDFQGGVWGFTGVTDGPPPQILVTVGPALQIRWREIDLSLLETHPLTPGLILVGPPAQTTVEPPTQTTTSDEPSETTTSDEPPETTTTEEEPPAATTTEEVPSVTSTEEVERPTEVTTGEALPIETTAEEEPTTYAATLVFPSTTLTLTSTAKPPSSTRQVISETSTRSSLSETYSDGQITDSDGSVIPSPTASVIPPGTLPSDYADNDGTGTDQEEGLSSGVRTGLIAVVLSAVLVAMGLMVLIYFLIRRRRPRRNLSERRQFGGSFFAWIAKRWPRDRGGSGSNNNAPDDPEIPRKPTQFDAELGGTVVVLPELDAAQRLGSSGNPAELEGVPVRWSWDSPASMKLSVISKVRSWLITTSPAAAAPPSRWTRSGMSERTVSEKAMSTRNSSVSQHHHGPPPEMDWETFAREHLRADFKTPPPKLRVIPVADLETSNESDIGSDGDPSHSGIGPGSPGVGSPGVNRNMRLSAGTFGRPRPVSSKDDDAPPLPPPK